MTISISIEELSTLPSTVAIYPQAKQEDGIYGVLLLPMLDKQVVRQQSVEPRKGWEAF